MEGVRILKSASHPNCSSQNLPSSSPVPSVMGVANAQPPPPPPPPPPLPPHLPHPPPLLRPPNPFGSLNGQRRSMKKLCWDAIPSQRVLGKLNVWTSKRPQRDLVLDIRSMEELFSHIDKRVSLRNSRVVGLRSCDGADLFPQEPQVTILDSKKSLNIGIFLRHFKRPVAEMVQDICEGNWLRFGTGKLKDLCKLLPEDSEVKLLLSFSGNLSVLPVADQFMVQLVKVPYYEERLKAMVLREEFSPLMEEVQNSVAVMTRAANELLDCDDLHSVIRLVLKAGNYMNAGGYTGNAIGFRMTSLLKLADTKANKPGMNLMHYVAKQAEDIDSELLTFPSQLEHIGVASRICQEDVITDFEKQVKKIKEVKLYSSRQPAFFRQMDTFLVRAEAKLSDVESHVQKFKALSNTVAEYFCEDPATFKLEECCSIFHSFCKRFDTAVQENRAREAAERRRKRKESVRVAAKCLSTVSCHGGEPDEDSSSLEAVLQGFLSAVPEGLARYRKNMLPPLKGASTEHSSQTVPLLEKTEAVPCIRREGPGKRQPKLPREDKELVNEGEAEKMHQITQKVLQHQNGDLDGERVSDAPHKLEGAPDSPATPSTPQPRTRDYFFAHDGDVGSPWTILSPFAFSQRKSIQLNRQAHQLRLPSAWINDEGVWESDKGNHLSNRESLTAPCGGSVSLPECPLLRPVSVDESRQSPASHFRLGDLFQRRMSQRSYSSGSRTENAREKQPLIGFVLDSKAENRVEEQVGTSVFISFLRRIGGRGQPGSVEEESKGLKT